MKKILLILAMVIFGCTEVSYPNDPNQSNNTTDYIINDGAGSIWLDFYTEDGDYIGDALSDRSLCYSSGIFADFETFKRYWTDQHTKKVEQLHNEMQKLTKALDSAMADLATASLMLDEE